MLSPTPPRSAAMTEHAVVIAGGGPTGLMLAGELALASVDVAVVERAAPQPGARRLTRGRAAFTGDHTEAGLADALTTWFGPPAAGLAHWRPSSSTRNGVAGAVPRQIQVGRGILHTVSV